MAGKTRWIWAAVVYTLLPSATYGQNGMLEELYGRGVHAYFSGNFRDAFDSLNAAVRSGSRDPRVYYFRGLTLSKFGRPDEARDDLRKAAEFEMLGGEPYSVGKALERIQGSERTMLENHRRAARLAIHNSMSAQERARYEQNRRREADVLRDTTRPPSPRAPGNLPSDATDPFTAPTAPPAPLPPASTAPVPVTPAAPTPAPADPFAAPAAERPLPAEAPLVPTAPTRAAPPPAPPAADPFAAPTTPATPPPAADPFATPPAAAPATPPPAADPFAAPPAATPPAPTPGADPFATPPASAPGTPAPPAADPFAPPPTSAPATPAPPAADPFAAPPAAP